MAIPANRNTLACKARAPMGKRLEDSDEKTASVRVRGCRSDGLARRAAGPARAAEERANRRPDPFAETFRIAEDSAEHMGKWAAQNHQSAFIRRYWVSLQVYNYSAHATIDYTLWTRGPVYLK